MYYVKHVCVQYIFFELKKNNNKKTRVLTNSWKWLNRNLGLAAFRTFRINPLCLHQLSVIKLKFYTNHQICSIYHIHTDDQILLIYFELPFAEAWSGNKITVYQARTELQIRGAIENNLKIVFSCFSLKTFTLWTPSRTVSPRWF